MFLEAPRESGKSLEYTPNNNNHGIYIFIISGELEIAGHKLSARDGIEINNIQNNINIIAEEYSEILIMEV